ncbi:hypothetical protein OIU84_001173 [Salix udensis]|uniref:Uncharacterized protein n=1 Tax=Salix udensis TaxID=889485 RepID=A0AAD6K6G7_9ROSI|nr:hypothetical protein OIU84_001173 [Salix udensis]
MINYHVQTCRTGKLLNLKPIEITLERAWNSLKWREKLGLVIAVVRGITSSSDISKSSFKASSTEDGTFQLYEQLSFSYPSLLQPLIHERDTYLAWSLKRSKAVNNSKRVVGVIGKGPYEWCNICIDIRSGKLAVSRRRREGVHQVMVGLMALLLVLLRAWLETLSLAFCCGNYMNR